jgi:hypothetical protein
MIALLRFLLALMTTPFKPMWRLEAENAAILQQLNVLHYRMKARPRLTNSDRWIFVALYRLFPSILDAIRVIQPETLVRWHRSGFRFYWRLKSRYRVVRTKIDRQLRELINFMNDDNPLWGVPHVHEEL